jgi:nucleoside-diphosphate-sugar epimerase
MRILVTGGTGFLGTRIMTALRQAGHEVFALARSPTSHKAIGAMGATPVDGDLEGRQAFKLPAIDAVVHAAALFRFAGPRKPYFRTNVDGTARLIEAASAAGAKTLVYVSAAGVIMDDRGSAVRGVDESAPTYPNSFSAYLASKAQGEALVLGANQPGFRTIAIRPPGIWGAGDMWSRELPGAIASGQFAFINRGDYPYATCHADNVVEAIECALERGTGGRAYFVNDQEKLTFREFVAMVASVKGLSVEKLRSMPYGIAFFVGRMMEAVWTMRGLSEDPPLSRSMVRMIGREFSTSDAAARRELGYVGKKSIAEGMREYSAAGVPPGALLVASE